MVKLHQDWIKRDRQISFYGLNPTIGCSTTIEKTALQMNVEWGVGGGPFNLIVSKSPWDFGFGLRLDKWNKREEP